MTTKEKNNLKREILRIIDFDWRDACSDICSYTHPKGGYNPHLVDTRKELLKFIDNSI